MVNSFLFTLHVSVLSFSIVLLVLSAFPCLPHTVPLLECVIFIETTHLQKCTHQRFSPTKFAVGVKQVDVKQPESMSLQLPRDRFLSDALSFNKTKCSLSFSVFIQLGEAVTKNPGYLKLRKIRAAQNIAKTVRMLTGKLIQHLNLVVTTYLMVIVVGVGSLAFFK